MDVTVHQLLLAREGEEDVALEEEVLERSERRGTEMLAELPCRDEVRVVRLAPRRAVREAIRLPDLRHRRVEVGQPPAVPRDLHREERARLEREEVIVKQLTDHEEEVADRFEKQMTEILGTKYAVMMNSGSSAMLVAVAALFYKKEKPPTES